MLFSRENAAKGIAFYTEENGRKYRVEKMNQEDPASLNLCTTNEDGELIPIRVLTAEEREEYNTFLRKRNRIIDLDGLSTSVPVTKKNIFIILISILIPVFTSMINFGPEAPKAGYVIGITISDLILMISGVISLGTGGILISLLGVLGGLLDVKSIISTSMFVQFVGFCIIGYGAEATPFGARLSYWMLKKWGNKPTSMVTVFLLASAFLSSFLSNTGTMILMSFICHTVMKQMGEKPGKSKFAAACMIAIVLGPNLGCCGFVQGSAGITLMCLSQLTSATQAGFAITPAQFSIAGWTTLLFVLPAVVFILKKMLKFESEGIKTVGRDYYDQKLKELGNVTGTEVRWILYVIGLIILLLLGFNTTTTVLLVIILSVSPVVGFTSAKTAFGKAVPWEIIICGVTMSNLATIINNSGLASVIANAVAPSMSVMPAFALMLAITLVAAVMAMYFVASTYAIIAICVTMTAPIIESIGLNPAIMLFPAIISINYMFGLFAQPIVTHNYRYGYWEKGKISAVGTVVMLAAVLLNCLVCYFLIPTLWGVPLHI